MSTGPDPELRTYQPSPTQASEEQTVTIRQGQQKQAADLRIAVSSTRGGEARFTVSQGPGIDKDSPDGGRGEIGDTVTLDNGYTITIEEVQDSAEDDAPGAGSGSATLTVTPPEE
ncbi:hypothetical protein [Allosalinactinospora lopnorensis]|uniref:hypothetical protein n=1 Tax=Allosalinactinospora lopnorensis TaxID=1352348 RepID=UPI0012E1E5CF|nr:hypothetical protein [Allosalinactinospora lopnorensis]